MPLDAWDAKAAPCRVGEYTLFVRHVRTKSRGIVPVYFFAKGMPRDTNARPAPCPPGYVVTATRRTGLPVLHKKGNDPNADLNAPESSAGRARRAEWR